MTKKNAAPLNFKNSYILFQVLREYFLKVDRKNTRFLYESSMKVRVGNKNYINNIVIKK